MNVLSILNPSRNGKNTFDKQKLKTHQNLSMLKGYGKETKWNQPMICRTLP
jgi:hypothetical protein